VKLVQLIYTLVFGSIFLFRYFYLAGDAADSSLFENIAIFGMPPHYETEFLKSIQVIIRKFVSDPSEVSILNFPTDAGLNGFLIGAHAYLIMPLISIISKVVTFKLMSAFVAATITMLPFFIALKLSTQSKGTLPQKTYWTVIVIFVSYPAILWSGLGQFYPDRLFLIFFPIFLLYLNGLCSSDKKIDLTLFFAFAFFSASMTERSSIYVAIACFIFSLTAKKNRLVILGTGILFLLWSLIYYRYISTDDYPNSFFDQAKSLEGLKSLLLSVPTLKLIIFHIPGVLLLRRMPDLQAFLLLSIAPNVLGNIGGAEKIGWVTHYMSYLAASYIGVILVYLARIIEMNSDGKLSTRQPSIQSSRFRSKPPIEIAITLLAISSLVGIDANSAGKLVDTNYSSHSGIFGKSFRWILQGADVSEFNSFLKTQSFLIKQIPANANIGVSEGTAKFVSGNFKNIYMFPAGIEKLDYVILKSLGNGQGYQQIPIVNYSRVETGLKLTGEVQAMLDGECFRDVSPSDIHPLYIFQRNWEVDLGQNCVKID
jgi:hypothetical protein